MVSMMGVSRSAVLVASYLMIFQHMSIMEALTSMRKKRAINPNEGFLKQLRELNENLMEERDDDDDTLSQCSVIDARTRACIFGEGGEDDDDDTDKEEEQSMIGVKAHSIMMEEEEDGESVMSSVASSAAAAALRSGLTGAQNGLDNQGSTSAQEEIVLPEQEGGEDGDDDEGLGSMIREWQRRNEKYQSDDWWEAQLNSDGEDGESLAQCRLKKTKEGADADVESVTSEDVRAVKERLKRRNRRPPSEAMSTSSCTSYSDLWKQRLREIEEQAAARYRKKEEDEGSESTATEGGEGGKMKIDDEVESILSDTSSMYNFCQKNKEKMTPLERWRVKRIQFGWNKKDREDGEKSSIGDGEKGDGEGEAKAPSFQDVNLTAYQSWKMRQQKRFGEENTEEILELSRGEDSATVKRRQRREEILERSKKNLEESQSMCGWESESCVSGGTIPLSAFWAGAGVTGPPSVANDDNMSMLSGRSSVISSVSQARSARSAQSAAPVNPMSPVPPILPVPTVQGPGGEPMVNLASIQNWIANVVSETIKQKQSEMSLPPPSRAGSELSFGCATSVISGRGVDDDKASLLSGASYSALSQGGGRAASVLSGGGSSSASGLTGRGSALGSTLGSALGSKKNKITTTSVPLFSLFQDQVNMGKLDAIDKEIKSEMRDKMATYEKKKILEDNKRSTLYKKKKPKEDEDEEEERKKKEEEFLEETKKKEKPTRSYGLSGCLNLKPALEKDKDTSIDDWLKSVRPPPRKPASGAEAAPSEDPYDDLDASASEFDFSSRRASYAVDEEDEETYGVTSRYRSRLHEDISSEEAEYSCNGFTQSHGYSRARRSYGAHGESDEATQGYHDLSSKRKFAQHSRYESSETEGRTSRREEVDDEEEDDIAAFIAQTRQRIRARAAAEAEDDEVLAAWRAQQEAKSQKGSES